MEEVKRKYGVWYSHDANTEVITRYFVTDALNEEDLKTRPEVAIFPISQLYDEISQRRKARAYAEYMNKILEATETAYEQTMLVDILKK